MKEFQYFIALVAAIIFAEKLIDLLIVFIVK